MATTYSTSLKLTLMGDGDQAGLWGQTTNTNLGTLLEQAITGVTSITMSDANYTLTSFNGVSDEARNAVLVVTGTNNAVRDLIPPVVEKLYTIVNNTTGGYAIRVIGASGTGVNIPNGATCLVYCDGTNFINGLSGSAGSFTVNGTLNATTVNATTGTFTTVSGNGVALTAINASNLTSGTVATARLGSGTANSATFLRGDQTYAVPVSVSNIAITDDTTTNASFFPTMTTATSGNVSTQTVSSTKLIFNPLSGLLTTYGGFMAASSGPFFMNDNTVSVSYTVPANVNAMSAGPITINTSITVTVDTNANWIVL